MSEQSKKLRFVRILFVAFFILVLLLLCFASFLIYPPFAFLLLVVAGVTFLIVKKSNKAHAAKESTPDLEFIPDEFDDME